MMSSDITGITVLVIAAAMIVWYFLPLVIPFRVWKAHKHIWGIGGIVLALAMIALPLCTPRLFAL